MIKNSIQSWDGHSRKEIEEYIKRRLESAASEVAERFNELLKDAPQSLDTLKEIADKIDTLYTKPETGIPATDLAEGVIPTISTDITTDGDNDTKTASPKAVKTYVDESIPAALSAIESEIETVGRGEYVTAWDGASTPVVADIPAGVSVTYNTTSYTGELAASDSTMGKIYLVSTGTADEYYRYVTARSGSVDSYTYSWSSIGSTSIQLSDYATKAEVSQLGQYLYKRYNAQNIRDNAYQNCVNGEVVANNSYFVVEGIPVRGYEKIDIARTVGTSDSGMGIVFYASDGTTKVGGFNLIQELNSITVPDNAFFANICVRKSVYQSMTQLLFQPYSTHGSIELYNDVQNNSQLITDIGLSVVSATLGQSEKYIVFNAYEREVQASSNANYKLTSPITVPAHSIIQTACYGLNSRISKVTATGYIPLVEGINNPNTIVGWTNNSDTPVDVVICYLVDLPKVWIYANVFSDIIGKYPEIERLGKLNDVTPSITWVDGIVVMNEVRTAASTYKHCSTPIPVKRGDIVFIKDARSGYVAYALFRTDNLFSFAQQILGGTEGTTAATRYYIIDFDGYIGLCAGYDAGYFNCRIFRPQEGIISELIKRDGKKKRIPLTVSSSQSITVDTIGCCPITQGLAKRISGNGNATITCTLAEQAVGRSFSVGFRVPYSFQNVARIELNGAHIPIASNDTRTVSGKAYLIEGDHFHRCNFNCKDYKLLSFNIVVTSSGEWSFEISSDGIVDDDLPLIPVMVGYDIAYNYQGTFPYEGENISIYELHKRLNIPYYVALTGDQAVVNPEVAEAIASGLCERVFYGGGDLADYWNKIDGSLSQQMILKKSAHEGMGTMYVVSQSVLDRNMYSAIINSGFDIIRHWGASENRQGEFGQMFGDNDVYYGILTPLGNAVQKLVLNFPQLWFGHGIGTPIDPSDPYASAYADPDGTKTIALFNMWKAMESRGQLAIMKPSDWIAYLKKCK